MPKEKIKNTIINEALLALESYFNKLDLYQKKTILKKIGLSKNDIEKLDNRDLFKHLKKEYNKVLSEIDLNDVDFDIKYKQAAGYMCGENLEDFKTEIKNYKKL